MANVRVPVRRGPRVSEKVEQSHIVQVLRSIGGHVSVLGTVRRRGDYAGTMQTPGLPDLVAFLPHKGGSDRVQLWVEVKARGGRLRPEQDLFRLDCLAAGVAHVVGGLDDVIVWLIDRGYVTSAQFAHYRQPGVRV